MMKSAPEADAPCVPAVIVWLLVGQIGLQEGA